MTEVFSTIIPVFSAVCRRLCSGLDPSGLPTAPVTYVMSREMQGDADFAVAAISASILFSALTDLFWLMVAVRHLYGCQRVSSGGRLDFERDCR